MHFLEKMLLLFLGAYLFADLIYMTGTLAASPNCISPEFGMNGFALLSTIKKCLIVLVVEVTFELIHNPRTPKRRSLPLFGRFEIPLPVQWIPDFPEHGCGTNIDRSGSSKSQEYRGLQSHLNEGNYHRYQNSVEPSKGRYPDDSRLAYRQPPAVIKQNLEALKAARTHSGSEYHSPLRLLLQETSIDNSLEKVVSDNTSQGWFGIQIPRHQRRLI